MPQSITDQIVAANEQYASGVATAVAAPAPTRKLAIVTCMDARIDPWRAFGLDEGGGVYIIRNGGGRVPDAIRSLVICQELLGTTEVAVIHHTDCGMLGFTDESLRERLRARGAEADHVAFGAFSDLEESVRTDLRHYAASSLVRHDIPVRGFIFDVDTGRLREIEQN